MLTGWVDTITTWRAVLASGKPGGTEARLRRVDGAYRWFLFRVVPLHHERGRLVKWYGTMTGWRAVSWSAFTAMPRSSP